MQISVLRILKMNFAGAKRVFEVCVFEVCGEERTLLRDERFSFAKLRFLLCEKF